MIRLNRRHFQTSPTRFLWLRRSRQMVAAAVLGVAAFSTSSAQVTNSAHSAIPPAMEVSGKNKGIPASVDPATDLASQGPDAPSDSIYFTSRVKGQGHDFGVLVHTLQDNPHDQRILAISITDETTGWYNSYQVSVGRSDYTWSTESLDIKMPGLTWTGDAKKMAVKASTPWGAVDFIFEVKGRALNYAGTGEWDMLGARQYQFALPSMRTTGTLTIEGKVYNVAGDSWLDRQWGNLPLGPDNRWTWMNISLSNGDRIGLWDIVGADTENCWATVLHPDGSYSLASVKPLADGADEFWGSANSGNTYPSRWRVEIPSLRADITVRISGPVAQELGSGMLTRYEGTATVAGNYAGQRVMGHSYVEMVGFFAP